MPTVTFDVPEGALSALRLSPIEFVKEMRVAAALLWYSKGEIKLARLCGDWLKPECVSTSSLSRVRWKPWGSDGPFQLQALP